jgi:hypothetical protein
MLPGGSLFGAKDGRHTLPCDDLAAGRFEVMTFGARQAGNQLREPVGHLTVELVGELFALRRGREDHRSSILWRAAANEQTATLNPVHQALHDHAATFS